MKARYLCTYQCRECGVFTKSSVFSVDSSPKVERACPKCGRLSGLTGGTFTVVQESKRILSKTQKQLEAI